MLHDCLHDELREVLVHRAWLCLDRFLHCLYRAESGWSSSSFVVLSSCPIAAHVGLDAWLRTPVASRATGEHACDNIGARARIKTTVLLEQSCST